MPKKVHLTTKHPQKLRFIIIATLLGNTLEWYDFALYGYLTPFFLTLFFPEKDPSTSLIHAFIVLAAGYIMRPLGSLSLGYFGDRFGRKKALIITVILMTIPVTLIGCLPTYAQIGLTATLLLAIFRLIQGFAGGGEYPGVMTFLVESSPMRIRGFFGSWAYFGIQLGTLIGALEFFLLDSSLPKSSLEAWGWRLPFFIGGLLGAVGLILRKKLHETPLYREAREAHQVIKTPIFEAFRKHKIEMVKSFGLSILDAIGYNTLVIFSTAYFSIILKMKLVHALAINTATVFFTMIFMPLCGWLSDIIGKKTQMVIASSLFVLLSYPLYLLYMHRTLHHALAGQAILSLLLAFYLAPLPAVASELFPTPVRYTCFAVSYNIGIAFVGGCTPLLLTYLISRTGFLLIPSLYLILAGLCALITLAFIRDRLTLKHQ